MLQFFTICSNNYLAQAITLGNSVVINNPGCNFIVGLADRKRKAIEYSKIPFEMIEVESIGITCFDEMVSKYSITELNTAVKPFYFQYLFNNSKAETVIYLDPDIQVFAPFEELEKALTGNDIIITPHFTTPINDDKWQAEEDFLNSGLYNLGFIALKKGKEAMKFLEWWAIRMKTKAFVDPCRGMFTDQIWINFAPLLFDKVYVFCHPGYNMAYWNLHERILNDKGNVVKNNISYPLVFFHFSGFSPVEPNVLSKYQNRFSLENRKDIVDLFVEYSDKLLANGYKTYVEFQSYYAIEKQKLELEKYITYKKSIPIYKRIIRSLFLRCIRFFKININYYTH